MPTTKRISVDQLRPGMYVVGMDQPWYRTPFLFHKRMVRDRTDVALLKQHGIREVTIDVDRGGDLEQLETGAPTPADSTQLKSELSIPTSDASAGDTPPDLPKKCRSHRNSREIAAAAKVAYSEAIATVDQVFADLESGHTPNVAAMKAVVGTVMERILDDRDSMLTQLTYQKMQRFDRTLASHALDVCVLSLVVAVEHGLSERECEEVGIGALLHDVGYVKLPRNLYRRDSDLSPEERSLMCQHPQLGAASLPVGGEFSERVHRIISEHHERLDGSGFPQGLKGDAWSPLAQLVGLIDAYDGFVSSRSGHLTLLPHDGIRQLFFLGEQGEFDKKLVEVTIKSLGVYPIGSLVRLNTGEQGVVVGVNPDDRLKPVVKLIAGTQGESFVDPLTIDLSEDTAGAVHRRILRVLNPKDEHVNVGMYFDLTPEGSIL